MESNKIQNKPNGLQCPVCRQLIPISIRQLMISKSIQCPVCGLVLSIDKNKSEKALKILSKINKVNNKLEINN